jgi:hypothetical protein
MKRYALLSLSVAVALLFFASTASATHSDCVLGRPGIETLEDQVECAIQKGLAWAASVQNIDGSWTDGYGNLAATGLYCVKLVDRAKELEVDPFDAEQYEYAVNLSAAITHLAGNLVPGDPGELKASTISSYTTYTTGISAMCFASAAELEPEMVATVGDEVLTYEEITLRLATWLTGNQQDGGCSEGGWYYAEKEYSPTWADNSISGYATMGLGFAQSLTDYAIPAAALNHLDAFIDRVQETGGAFDGGSNYGGSWSGSPPTCSSSYDWINILKTGNLLYELCLIEDPETSSRVSRALDFIQRFWGNNGGGEVNGAGWLNNYQAIFTMMKGLEGCGIETLDIGEVEEDWFALVAQWIIDDQLSSGAFYNLGGDGRGNPQLHTAWALLTLERAVPRLEFGIPDQCVPYGTGFEPFDANDYVVVGEPPYTWTFSGNEDLSVEQDDSLFTVTYPEGWVGSETLTFTATDNNGKTSDDTATFTVSAVPIVGDIPDQVAPFETFDLDDYLLPPVPASVAWTAAGNSCLGVTIGAGNVVTVTNPGNACQDPETVTFTASAIACEGEVTDSDDATFTPNQPPDCSEAAPSLATLWPPNHRFVGIGVLGVTDPDGDPVTIMVDSIFQDEPVDTLGDGSFTPDGQGAGTDTASVRAERAGTPEVPGDGRVYHISFTADDGRGGSCSGEVLVGVPHDRGQGSTPVDGGALYDSTAIAP